METINDCSIGARDVNFQSKPIVDSGNICYYDISVIRKHCFCGECKDYFTTQEKLLPLFKLFAKRCPGCPVRTAQPHLAIEAQDGAERGDDGKINDDFLICSLGKHNGDRHYLKDAQFLPCFHHSCRNCLNQEASRQAAKIRDNGGMVAGTMFCCPECDTKIPFMTISGDDVDRIAFNDDELQLQSNSLKSIANAYIFEKRLQEGKEFCDHCPANDRKEAIAECVDDDMTPLCEECLRRHKSGRATSHHKIIRADSLEQLATPRARFAHYNAPTCERHQDCKLCMYCPHHKTVVCIKCSREAAAGHEDCRGLILFDVNPHFEEEMYQSHVESFEEQKKTAESISQHQHTIIKRIESKVEALSSHCDDIICELNRRSSCLKQAIENQRQKLVCQTQRIEELKEDEFNVYLQQLKGKTRNMDHCIGWIQSFKNAATPTSFFIFKHIMECKMDSFSDCKMEYQDDDDLIMNVKMFHKTNSALESLPYDFILFCENFFGRVYSTPCLKAFTIMVNNSQIVLSCRDAVGTKLQNEHLPDITAQLVATDLMEEVPPGKSQAEGPVNAIMCKVEKKILEGSYEIKPNNLKKFRPGIYFLLVSNGNPSAYFNHEEHGKKFKLKYSKGNGFELLTN